MKVKKILSVLTVISLVFCLISCPVFAEDGLIASWDMEAENGVVADSSGNGLNLSGTFTSEKTDGAIGGYARFAGNDNLSCANNEKFGGMDQLSISFWTKPEKDAESGSNFLVDKDGVFRMQYDAGSITFVVATANTGWYSKTVWVPSIVPDGEWTHIVGNYDGQKLELFANGVSVGSCEGINGAVASSDSMLYVSRANNPGTTFVRGMDEVKIYDRALSEKEIKDLYNKGNGGGADVPHHPALMAFWNEVDGEVLLDGLEKNNGDVSDSDKIQYTSGPNNSDAFRVNGGSVSVADSVELDGMDSMTFAAWARMDKMPEKDGGVLVGKDNGDASYRLRIKNDGSLIFSVATENNEWYTPGTAIITKEKLQLDHWYYIAAEYDGSYIYIYVNGELWAKSDTPISGAIKNTDSSLYFGSMSCNEELYASIHNAALYNVALEQAELKEEYQKEFEAAYMLDIGFEEGKAVDYSGNEITLTEMGNPEYTQINGKGCMRLDGVDDALLAGGIPSAINVMSIRAKVKFNNLTGSNLGFISRDNAQRSDQTAFHCLVGSELVFAVKSGGQWYSGNFHRLIAPAPETGRWLDIEIGYNKGQCTYYCDGELIGTVFTGSGGGIDSSELPLYIGYFSHIESENYLNADFERVTMLSDFIASSKDASEIEVGGEEALEELNKKITCDSLSELYIPREDKLTYKLSFSVNGENADMYDFIITANKPGVTIDNGKLIIDSTAEEGNLEMLLTYKYDSSVKQAITIPVKDLKTPKVDSVNVDGKTSVGSVLTAKYTYTDKKVPLKNVTYVWEKSSNGKDYKPISNATTATFTSTKAEENCYVRVGVKAITFLEDYIEEEVPSEIVYSNGLRINAQSKNTSSGGYGIGRGSLSTATTPISKPSNNNNTDGTTIDKGFKDIDGHWAYNDITELKALGIISGVSEDEFAPNSLLTRAQMAAMLVRAFSLQDSDDTEFADVGNEWYKDDVKKISASGIMNGSDGYFYPDNKITRQELAKAIDNMLQKNGKTDFEEYDIDGFTDSEKISAWAEQAIAHMCSEKIMVGMENGAFEPGGYVTRAQAATVINRILKLK